LSNRSKPLSSVQQLDVGALVAGLREQGLCWKRLEDHFQMSRAQLWRCQRRYERHCRMQQQDNGMQHQPA
jgi:hypothetical protein